jgi:hypothetical protein
MDEHRDALLAKLHARLSALSTSGSEREIQATLEAIRMIDVEVEVEATDQA